MESQAPERKQPSPVNGIKRKREEEPSTTEAVPAGPRKIIRRRSANNGIEKSVTFARIPSPPPEEVTVASPDLQRDMLNGICVQNEEQMKVGLYRYSEESDSIVSCKSWNIHLPQSDLLRLFDVKGIRERYSDGRLDLVISKNGFRTSINASKLAKAEKIQELQKRLDDEVAEQEAKISRKQGLWHQRGRVHGWSEKLELQEMAEKRSKDLEKELETAKQRAKELKDELAKRKEKCETAAQKMLDHDEEWRQWSEKKEKDMAEQQAMITEQGNWIEQAKTEGCRLQNENSELQQQLAAALKESNHLRQHNNALSAHLALAIQQQKQAQPAAESATNNDGAAQRATNPSSDDSETPVDKSVTNIFMIMDKSQAKSLVNGAVAATNSIEPSRVSELHYDDESNAIEYPPHRNARSRSSFRDSGYGEKEESPLPMDVDQVEGPEPMAIDDGNGNMPDTPVAQEGLEDDLDAILRERTQSMRQHREHRAQREQDRHDRVYDPEYRGGAFAERRGPEYDESYRTGAPYDRRDRAYNPAYRTGAPSDPRDRTYYPEYRDDAPVVRGRGGRTQHDDQDVMQGPPRPRDSSTASRIPLPAFRGGNNGAQQRSERPRNNRPASRIPRRHQQGVGASRRQGGGRQASQRRRDDRRRDDGYSMIPAPWSNAPGTNRREPGRAPPRDNLSHGGPGAAHGRAQRGGYDDEGQAPPRPHNNRPRAGGYDADVEGPPRPQNSRPRSGNNSNRGGQDCYVCGRPGHIARNCPQRGEGVAGGRDGRGDGERRPHQNRGPPVPRYPDDDDI